MLEYAQAQRSEIGKVYTLFTSLFCMIDDIYTVKCFGFFSFFLSTSIGLDSQSEVCSFHPRFSMQFLCLTPDFYFISNKKKMELELCCPAQK
jgi:hypothetical protein